MQEILLKVLNNSARPFERLSDKYVVDKLLDKKEFDARMISLKESLGDTEDNNRLARYLKFHRLSEDKLLKMFSPGEYTEPDTIKWFSILRNIFSNKYDSQFYSFIKDKNETIQFEELYVPFIYELDRKIKEQHKDLFKVLSLAAYKKILRHYLGELSNISGKVLTGLFENFKELAFPKESKNYTDSELYKIFIQKHIDQNILLLFVQYPMLCRLCCNQIMLGFDFISTYVTRFELDRSDISKFLNLSDTNLKITDIQMGISDTHKGGESVIVTEIDNNSHIVYKPNKTNICGAFNEFCELLKTSYAIELATVDFIDRINYGWFTYVSNSECKDLDELRSYYFNAGSLLAITYILESTDLHAENLIADGSHPTIIDLETILQHRYLDKTNTSTNDFENVHNSFDVTRSVLLPMNLNSDGRNVNLISGFDSIVDSSPNEVLGCSCSSIRTSNLPKYNGYIQNIYDYSDIFIQGFRQSYNTLLENKHNLLQVDSIIKSLNRVKVRYVFRNTFVYGKILAHLNQSKYLVSGLAYGLRLELISRAFIKENIKPHYWNVLEGEREQMMNGDIPYFEALSDDVSLFREHMTVVDSFFESDCLTSIRRKISRLSQHDMERQIQIINEALYGKLDEKFLKQVGAT